MSLSRIKKSFLTLFVVIFVFSIAFSQTLFVTKKAIAASSKPTLTYWTRMDAKVAVSYNNYAQIGAYQLLMKKLNVKLQFIHPPMGGEYEQFNLMLASKKLPDIIEWTWIRDYPGGPAKAIADKVIIPLNEPVEKYGPNFKKFVNSNPDIKRMITLDDGTLYCFPFIREAPENRVSYGPMIRKDWLNKLKLSVPETVDDWTNVLLSFRNNQKILNENKQPVYPFSIAVKIGNGLRTSWSGNFLVGAWGITMDLYVENGKVKYGPLTSGYKEFIRTIQKWWKENLIDPDILSMNTQSIDAKVLNDQIGAFIGRVSGEMGRYLQAKKGTSFDLAATPLPVLKKGQIPELGPKDIAYPGHACAAITTSCKNIPLATKVLDWNYSKEGYMALNFGIEGKSYVMKNGKPVYTDAVTKDPKLSILEALSRYARAGFNGPFVQSRDYVLQVLPFPQQNDALIKWGIPSNNKMLPPVTLTTDESKKVSNILSSINTYYDEMFARLLTGKVTNIDSFQRTLKRMGIDEVIKVYQNAYNRYIKKKI